MFAVNLRSPRRVFHGVFAVILRALGGLCQCMRFSRELTVVGILDSVIWAHNLASLPSPVDIPIIRDISKAAKKMNGARVVNRDQALTADMIGNLVSAPNLSNLLELRNVKFLYLLLRDFSGSMRFFILNMETFVFGAVM